MKLKYAGLALVLGGLSACTPTSPEETNETSGLVLGEWQGSILQNDSTDLKFNFKLSALNDSIYGFTVFNAEEKLEAKMLELVEDSFRIEMPVFANHFLVKHENDQLKGYYINPDADNYQLPFSAEAGNAERYPGEEPLESLNGYWRIDFDPGTEDQSSGLAHFDWSPEQGLYATVMTATGDYRYLEGASLDGQMKFSAFDGAHLFTFQAFADEDTLRGDFHSGRSYYANWIAYRDTNFSLPDPDTLTYIKEGFDGMYFSFPNLEGDTVNLEDARFEDKAVIVQISGSWCPNCYDESRYLSEVYSQYNSQDLEIVCLSFERTRDYATAQKRLGKMKKDLAIPYTVLLAGATREDKAAEKLPMLNHIMSYPTAIYLDKNHQVRKIHTGFAGPGTPVWEDFVSENDAFLQKLLNE